MRLCSALIASISLCLPVLVSSADEQPTPKIEIEVVWTDIRQGKTDFFYLVSNPNDFDVHVGMCGSGTFQQNNKVIFGDGPACSSKEDFVLLPAKSKLLFQLERGCELEPGLNHFKVGRNGSIDPKSKLPWNYVVAGTTEFEFEISNGKAAKR